MKDTKFSRAVSQLSEKDKIHTVLDLIVRLVEEGNFVETACSCAGVLKHELDRWLRVGEKEWLHIRDGGEGRPYNAAYLDFYLRIKRAQGMAESRFLAIIRDAAVGKDGKPSWQAAAWILERSRPYHWGKKTEHFVTAGTVETSAPPSEKQAREMFESILKAHEISGGKHKKDLRQVQRRYARKKKELEAQQK